MSPANWMLWTLALPLLALVSSLLLRRWEPLRDLSTLALSLASIAPAALLWTSVLQDAQAELGLLHWIPGLSLQLSLEPLGMLFSTVVALLWPLASLYSISYLRANKESHRSRFFACFALSIFGAQLVALSGNLLTLFVGYEILTLATYPLVVHHSDAESRHGGRIYLGLLLSSSIGLLLPAIIWTWNIAGTLDFAPQGILAGRVGDLTLSILLLMYAYGIGKAALMPLHRWLPAAMVAPAPVSALLHAVAVVKAGVFSLLKILLYVFGVDLLADLSGTHLLFAIAATSVILASLIALRQDNLKRRLAYSTISQLSYVTLAALVLAPLSLVGAALHIAAHAFGKITLFFAAGAIHTASHKTLISQLSGIGFRMPWTMSAFAVAALSMIGLPPLAGFVSKWFMLEGTWQTEHYAAMAVLVLSTLLNAMYFVPILYRAWFVPSAGHDEHGEAPIGMLLGLLSTGLLTLMLGLFPEIPLQLIDKLPVFEP